MTEASDETLIQAITVTAGQLGLEIPEGSLSGVVANTRLLRRYAALVEGFTLPDDIEPAYEYHP